jgi:hypothetical protein
MDIGMLVVRSWIVCGIIGYVLRMIHKETRPKTSSLCLVALVTHTLMGYLSLFYGYVCYSTNRKTAKKVKNENN